MTPPLLFAHVVAVALGLFVAGILALVLYAVALGMRGWLSGLSESAAKEDAAKKP